LVVGFAAGRIPSLPFNIALLKGASLIGVDSTQIQKWEPDAYAKLMRELAEWLKSGRLQPPPTQVFPLSQFQEAFEAMSSRHAMGKVVVTITPGNT
jgi:NADPH2:quinone reductase